VRRDRPAAAAHRIPPATRSGRQYGRRRPGDRPDGTAGASARGAWPPPWSIVFCNLIYKTIDLIYSAETFILCEVSFPREDFPFTNSGVLLMALPNKEGQRVPNVKFPIRAGNDWKTVTTDDLFKGKTVVVFSL